MTSQMTAGKVQWKLVAIYLLWWAVVCRGTYSLERHIQSCLIATPHNYH